MDCAQTIVLALPLSPEKLALLSVLCQRSHLLPSTP